MNQTRRSIETELSEEVKSYGDKKSKPMNIKNNLSGEKKSSLGLSFSLPLPTLEIAIPSNNTKKINVRDILSDIKKENSLSLLFSKFLDKKKASLSVWLFWIDLTNILGHPVIDHSLFPFFQEINKKYLSNLSPSKVKKQIKNK